MNPTLHAPTPSITLDMSDPFEVKLAMVVTTHRERNPQYITSPLEILPVENWLTQVAIKGVRAQQAVSTAKVRDELIDTAVYAIMALEQIDKREWSRPEYATTSKE